MSGPRQLACAFCSQRFSGDFNAHRNNECPDDHDPIRPAFRRRIEQEAVAEVLAKVRTAIEAEAAEATFEMHAVDEEGDSETVPTIMLASVLAAIARVERDA